MFLQTSDTDKEYPLHWAKIRKNGTLLVETGETGEEKYHHGIFVDIFPYDYYESEYVIKKLQWARTTKDEKNKYPKGSLKRLLAGLYANVFCCVSMRAIETKRKYLIEHRAEYTADKCHFFSYSADVGYVYPNTVDEILPVKLAENIFEGHSFYVPNRPERLLEATYGHDYMQLPPVEQRKTHAKKIGVNF